MTSAPSPVAEISVEDLAAALLRHPPPSVIDVRERHEHAAGVIAGAALIPRGALEHHGATAAPDKNAPVVTYCESGVRSAEAATTLRRLGYTTVHSLRGGFSAWQRAGKDWVVPVGDGSIATLRTSQAERYARHLRLPEIGLAGQQKLLAARVLCVGAGGLGSPASLYLAAAGIGILGIVDDDVVELSNLHRQIIHTSDRLGRDKVDSAAESLARLNPDTTVHRINARLGPDNVQDILTGYDLIVDGSDNFATRYLINDAALMLAKPVVHAAVQRFEGQLAVFGARGGPCYRCVFPAPPPARLAPSCAEAGVLGVLPGVLGVLQATEAIKLITGIGQSLSGRMLTYDALTMTFSELQLTADAGCQSCASIRRRPDAPASTR
jgi:sulfur-carrier protein adenylyltransferase/sulfurtransferase